MALVDVPDGTGTYSGNVEVILRAVRLGLITGTEAGLLIEQVRPRTATTKLSIPDGNRARVAGQKGRSPSSPDRTVR